MTAVREEKMSNDRREFMKLAAATAAGAAVVSNPAATQSAEQFKNIKALTFDFYGTCVDVFAATAPAYEQLFPGKGTQLAQIWRAKQLLYLQMRTVMGRYRHFSGVAEDALIFAANSLQLDLTDQKKKRLADAFFLEQPTFPDVKPGLEAMKKKGVKLAVVANGEQKTMEARAKSVGILDLFDEFISVDEVKVYKVHPRAYNLGSEHLQMPNCDIGFVAAHSWDIMGAASAGLTTFWIQRSPTEVPEELGFRATAVVKTMTDIAPLLPG
jgi:2-haloacid dehalogenase